MFSLVNHSRFGKNYTVTQYTVKPVSAISLQNKLHLIIITGVALTIRHIANGETVLWRECTEVDFPMKWLIYIEENATIQTGDHKNKGGFH